MRFAAVLAVAWLCLPVAGVAQVGTPCVTGQITELAAPQPPPFAGCSSCDSTTTGDCDQYRSNPLAFDLDETGPLYRIPIVFHVLTDSMGTGFVSDSLIAVQMEMLNSGFMALAGSFAEGSTPTRIMFKLAGVNRVENTEWFENMTRPSLYSLTDSIVGEAIYWDTSQYFNVVTMCGASSECGGLGGTRNGSNYPWFAAGWPWFDSARMQFDGIGDPTRGRILLHEAGHYLGLHHIEQQLCSPDCDTDGNRTGDLVDDTAPYPYPACFTPLTCVEPDSLEACGEPYPDFNNYLQTGGTPACWNRFTDLQIGRMRCGLKTYRPALYDSIVTPTISVDAATDTLPVCPAGDAYSVVVTVDFSESVIHADSIGAAEITMDLPDESLLKFWAPTDTPLPTPRRAIADSAATPTNDFTTTITYAFIGGCDDASATVRLNGIPVGDAVFSIRSFDYHTSSPGHVDASDLARFAGDFSTPPPDPSVECSELAPPIDGDVTASDLAAFAVHFGDSAPEEALAKPARCSTALGLREETCSDDQTALAVDLQNVNGVSALGLVLRLRPGALEFLDWQETPELGARTFVYEFTDHQGPKIVVLLLQGEALRGEEVRLGRIGCRVLREAAVDASDVTVAFAQMQTLDGATWTLSHGEASLPETGPAFVTTLEQNVPNPFNPTTEIRYSIGRESHVMLAIYDVRGRLLRTLVDGTQPPDHYRMMWDGRDKRGQRMPSGIYLYKLTTDDLNQTRKLVLVQ